MSDGMGTEYQAAAPVAVLAYAPAAARETWGQQLVHFGLIGPVAGAVAGMIIAGVAILVWITWGEPDFYFRGGWSGVDFLFASWTFGGGFVGFFYGTLLLLFEKLSGRRIRPILTLFALTCLTLLFTLTVVNLEFARGALLPMAVQPEVVSMFGGAAAAMLTSKRKVA